MQGWILVARSQGGRRLRAVRANTVIEYLHRVVLPQDRAGLTDGQLLESFVSRKDEAAFTALVRRHGPMVLGVCRRILRNYHDAEDAWQATFLVLARKAPSVQPTHRVANWLHGVAFRTALKARALRAKRQVRERQVQELPEPAATPQTPWNDLQPLLDRELQCLPAIYRLPILLCDLEGKSIKEATRQLGWPQGTLSGRLARGRKMLAQRLTRRGLLLSGGALGVVVSQNVASARVPTLLLSSTVKAGMLMRTAEAAVVGIVPARVAALAERMLQSMFLAKIKTMATVLLTLGMLVTGAGLLTHRMVAAQQARTEQDSVQSANLPSDGLKQEEETQALHLVEFVDSGNVSSSGGKPEPARTDLDRLQPGGSSAYKSLFGKTLALMAEYFEQIDYANQYDGRIEGSTVAAVQEPPPLTRRGSVLICAGDEGSFSVSVRIYKGMADGDKWRPVGRDAELESMVLQRLKHQQDQKEGRPGDPSSGSTKRRKS
jgi:RNA polymerase sigma factor (sigma-70 family)